jgi:hypothetical protein
MEERPPDCRFHENRAQAWLRTSKEQRMEATQQSVQENAKPAGFEPEIVAFCCEF